MTWEHYVFHKARQSAHHRAGKTQSLERTGRAHGRTLTSVRLRAQSAHYATRLRGANEHSDTLNLRRSDKHKREPERESAADAAIAEAHEATARRHARELRAKESLAKFNSLQKTPDRPTLIQRLAPKTNVVVGPLVPFALPMPPLKPPS